MIVIYEWDIETTDEHGDIIDHSFSDKLKDLYAPVGSNKHLVLVRNVYNKYVDLVDRNWAYVKEGGLPEYFSDAYGRNTHKVPKKYHRELAELRKKNYICYTMKN